ncbi:Sister chromatid cohesion 1 protein 1 [Camellia lanceoleosa]|uniref:Sister chromatid cohesion 1 protein 1 n=1 Tax=Camellia lanceoleosa TaxID=1840588 RepID=A0ACC0H4J2_9ERIC|nr:Sister chromatid cohesion 1 protein 1 [Camellia lanceoleosa]
MFYSHQLLARKAPLGQIWMAATMHAKINRRKLNKLNIITICEEILNPSVPMALRLSGILMGGVVIVYERKVKLLYDDVNRFLVELNEAWKVKSVPDPTLLPKGKSQAKYEAVTLPYNNQEAELGEIEESLTNTRTMMGFQQTGYIAMRLDNVDEPYINNNNSSEKDQSEQYHQADAANITLFDSYQTDTRPYHHFERFDIEGDNETQLNFNSQEDTQIPSTLIPSPPRPAGPQKPDEILDRHPEDQVNQQPNKQKEAIQPQQDHQSQGPTRRKARKPAASAMDYEQTIIPGHIYQSWLQSTSDIVSRRGRKRKIYDAMSTMEIGNLMELPPVALICGLSTTGNREIHYPAPLLELWMRSTIPTRDLPSGRKSPPQPPEPSSSSPPDRAHYTDPLGFPFEDFHNGLGSQSLGVSREKLRTNLKTNEIPTEVFIPGLSNNLGNNGVRVNEANVMVTPGNSGDEVKSIPSSGSGNGFLSNNSDVNSGRSNKKRPYSSSRHDGSGLEPVAEENSWQQPDLNFKLARLSKNGLTPDNDLLVETGPTQTQQPIFNPPIDLITDSIQMQLKTHFDTPGTSQTESLNELAFGLNKKKAAHLFYQTCVLASRDVIRVEQDVPYGDILISRGLKM